MRVQKKYKYIINFYKNKIKEFGPNNKGLAWESEYKNKLKYYKYLDSNYKDY